MALSPAKEFPQTSCSDIYLLMNGPGRQQHLRTRSAGGNPRKRGAGPGRPERGNEHLSAGQPRLRAKREGGESGNDGAAAGNRTERADGNEENYLREGERGHPGRGCSVNGTYQLLLRFLVFAPNLLRANNTPSFSMYER